MSSEKKKIFIVDDDTSVGQALGVLLATHGFSVKTFTCAEDFFNAVPNSTPGCLLLDIHMSGLDGWGAQQRLLKSGSSRPVIMMSADRNEEFSERALKAGAAGYLQKPFTDQVLVDLIQVAIKKKEMKKKR